MIISYQPAYLMLLFPPEQKLHSRELAAVDPFLVLSKTLEMPSTLKSLQLDSIDFDDDLKSILKTEFFNSIDFYFNVSFILGLGIVGGGCYTYALSMHTYSMYITNNDRVIVSICYFFDYFQVGIRTGNQLVF